LRERWKEVEARGAGLAIVGNGNAAFAAAFREDLALPAEVTLLVDPELRAYRAAGLRRGRVEALSPRIALNGLRAFGRGFRQTGIEGDPWQLGGAFVLRPDGACTFRQVSREAGDHADLDRLLEALAPDAEPVRESERPALAARALSRALSLALDPTVVLSFDRTGFAVHALGFDPDDLAVDLSGRRALVTGANSGIGFETALGLADLGAEVELLCRNLARGEKAADEIRARTGSRRVSVEVLDVSDLGAVRKVGARLASRRADVLVHNAGVLADERRETKDGLELAFATHVAGPHQLTRMYTRRLNVDDPQWRRRRYDGVTAYAETKRAQVVLAELWAEALADTPVHVSSMHPGWADTPAVASSLPRFHRLTQAILRTPAEGADTVLWLAAAAPAREAGGRFFFDRAPRRTHVLPRTRESAADRRALWELCQRLAEK
jgi:dehydrogenase/reductase SDR family protein 12